MLSLFPEGFEEAERRDGLELAAYTDGAGCERMRGAFGQAASVPVEHDWADRWREFHRPVRAGPFWVGPPWEQPRANELAVVVDPGRAFGTGAHPTTRLCLELIAEAESGSLLDIGCGSGVLAIAAAKLGFAPTIAVDSDPAAIEATRTNAERNAVSLDLRQLDALADPLPATDVAVANLTLRGVEALAPRLSAKRLIASGYLESDNPALTAFKRRERRAADGWAADVFERPA
jgi:ribosomal protein L11 methyltransferase